MRHRDRSLQIVEGKEPDSSSRFHPEMLYAALATDYDGTIAHHGIVPDETVEALRWLKERGKILILVTGRELPELQGLFAEIGLFDAVVAENGALLYLPGQGELRPLGPEPPQALIDALRVRHISPLSVGHSVVATWSPHETTVLEIVRELGLEWQIIFNKGAVMCLPPGINKASGLAHALEALGLSPLNVIAVGDAENDHAFLTTCGYSVAVANALDSVKDEVDLVTGADHGAGVLELIHAWMTAPETFGTRMRRHGVLLDGGPGARLFPAFHSVLIAGASGRGKSTLAMALMEAILDSGAQLVALDPEGDYDGLEGPTHLGTAERPPSVEEVRALMENPRVSVLLGLLGVEQHERPVYLSGLLASFAEPRAKLGRPHWILVDEAHHFLPVEASLPAASAANDLRGAIFVTVEPRSIAPSVLKGINFLVATGPEAAAAVEQLCAVRGCALPELPAIPGEDEAWVWEVEEVPPALVTLPKPRTEHRRHVRKYAEGNLSEERSFFFRGPEKKLNLRAHNLVMFLELAAGVDEETWLYHLREGDFSTWLHDAIGDRELASEVAAIERDQAVDAPESLELVRAAVQRRYTAPVG